MTDINRYYHPKFKLAAELIGVLYDLPECSSGGLCHIVTDDDNIDDDDLDWVYEYCNRAENIDRIDRELSQTICTILRQMTFTQRAVLFEMMISDFEVDDEKSVNSFIKYLGKSEIINRINSYRH